MTTAILKLDGMQRIEGAYQAGGDYVRLTITGQMGPDDFQTATDGEIDIDGRTSKVVLENATAADQPKGSVVLTLRLFKPLA